MLDADRKNFAAPNSNESPDPRSCQNRPQRDSPIFVDTKIGTVPNPTPAGKYAQLDQTQSLYLQPPRLGIIHFLAWMTVTAVLLKICMAFAELNSPIKMNYDLCRGIFLVILYSAAITGALVVLIAKYHGGQGHFQPGHFLLFYASLAVLGNWALYFCLKYSFFQSSSMYLPVFPIIVMLPQIFLFFWFAAKTPEQGRWQYTFRIWGFIYLLNLILTVGPIWFPYSISAELRYIQFPVIPLLSILQFAVFVITVALDLIHGSRRDWLHWLGTSVIILSTVITFRLSQIKLFY
jgi:hypothetical protein